VKAEEADEQSLHQLADAMIPRLVEQGIERERIAEILCQIEPFKSAAAMAQGIINEKLDRYHNNG
jgi:hypothetical protein